MSERVKPLPALPAARCAFASSTIALHSADETSGSSETQTRGSEAALGSGRRLQEGAGGAQAGRLGWHVVGKGCGVYLWQRGDASVAEPRRIHHVLRVCAVSVPPEVEPGLFDKLVAGRAGGDGGGG